MNRLTFSMTVSSSVFEAREAYQAITESEWTTCPAKDSAHSPRKFFRFNYRYSD